MIIDTCYRHGMFKMTKRVYESMRSCRILPSNAIFRCFFHHQKKELKMNRGKDGKNGGGLGGASAQMRRPADRQKKDRADNEYSTNREYLLTRKEE